VNTAQARRVLLSSHFRQSTSSLKVKADGPHWITWLWPAKGATTTNTKTEGRDPVSGESAPLYHPRQQRWRDHFAWNDDFTLVIGLTPIGRATIEALQLNRDGVVNLRRILYAMGEHPPADIDK